MSLTTKYPLNTSPTKKNGKCLKCIIKYVATVCKVNVLQNFQQKLLHLYIVIYANCAKYESEINVYVFYWIVFVNMRLNQILNKCLIFR